MQFSYFVDEQCLLDNINLPLVPQHISLITGIANINLNLLGGIIAKFFPLSGQEVMQPQINSLLSLYSGKLQMQEGSLPQKAVYVGPDPEKHLFFAKVSEEMLTRLACSGADFVEILQVMGLDASFLSRRIASLSGGEKMKVALAIALAQKADCYLLHGVVPWLDKNGREHLWKQLQIMQTRGAHIVFCENEIDEILSFADYIYYFDGCSLMPTNNKGIKTKLRIDDYNFLRQQMANTDSEKLLEFTAVSLLHHPHYSVERAANLLDKISFNLFVARNYLMFGNNGSGKSTITQIIFRLIKADSGCIKLLGSEIKSYSRKQLKQIICYVSQNPGQQLIFSTLGQYRWELLNESNTLALELFDEYFAKLPDDYPLTKLTFLQYKILTLLNFINDQTKIIILDEPTWGIDYMGRRCLLELLNKLAQKIDFTLLVISHDLSLAPLLGAEILWLYNGKLLHFDNIAKMNSAKLSCSFCNKLISKENL